MANIAPDNIIKGLISIIEINADSINGLLAFYRDETSTLHVFEGLRKTLPLSSYPSLELEPVSNSNEWLTTSAQTGEYRIGFTLTVNCDNETLGAEYISQVTRRVVQIFNYPPNMSFIIPNEYQGLNKEPVYVQFGYIGNVNYSATKDGTRRVATWEWAGKVIEGFPSGDLMLGPKKMEYKEDVEL